TRRAGDCASYCSACRTDAGAYGGILRYASRLAAALFGAGRFSRFPTGFDVFIPDLFAHAFQMRVLIQHWPSLLTCAEHEGRAQCPDHRRAHVCIAPFGIRRVMTSIAVVPSNRTRLYRLLSPDSMCTAAVGSSNSSARKRINSLFAAPATGGAAIRILSAS